MCGPWCEYPQLFGAPPSVFTDVHMCLYVHSWVCIPNRPRVHLVSLHPHNRVALESDLVLALPEELGKQNRETSGVIWGSSDPTKCSNWKTGWHCTIILRGQEGELGSNVQIPPNSQTKK